MPQSFAALYVHLVFSTKHRAPTIEPAWTPQLFEYLGGIMNHRHGKLLASGGTTDHVHLLLSLGRESSLSDLVRDLKAGSSKWVHETFPEARDFAWQAGYGAFSVSQSNLPQVRQYLANQEEHHRTVSFQDEFRALLTKHGLTWDERYVWD